MATEQEMNKWIVTSEALLRVLLPKEADTTIFGNSMGLYAFSELIRNQSDKVDSTLATMALSADKDELKAIVDQQDKNTVIALCARWIHFMEMWNNNRNPNHWVPETADEVWRAILLSMVQNQEFSADAIEQIWGEEDEEAA